MDSATLGLILGLVGTAITGGSAIAAALLYKRMGGGKIQLKINDNYKVLAETLERRITNQSQDLAECMDKVNEFLIAQDDKAKEDKKKEQEWEREKARWRREKSALKQEIDDLRDQVRELRREVKT